MKVLFPFLCSFFVSCSVDCKDCDVPVKITETRNVKLIKFSNDQLSKKDGFEASKEKDYSKGILPMQVDLGMNDVPVLDQGQYGTCVTFSSTAALDALLVQGDFISQQCSLELDVAIGDNYWNGAYYPSQIIDPLKKYGVVNKYECDNDYPVVNVSISLSDYAAASDQDASAQIAQVSYKYFNKASLPAVKAALNAGHRVLIGFQLQNSSQAVRGFDVVVNEQKMQGGLWACQQGKSANYCVGMSAGHEVVIIGYDDKQELLKIRNSWSDEVGDQGDYYMTYTYFSKNVIDQTEVWL